MAANPIVNRFRSRITSFSRTRVLESVTVMMLGLFAVLRVAWMSDDGLINIRTALNLSVGAGPVFNVGERVQGYTSPLWFWLQYVVGDITGEFIVTAIVLAAVCSVTGLAIIVFSSSSWLRGVTVFLGFVLSWTLTDYSTGGLENGLGSLLIALALVFAHRLGSNSTIRNLALAAGALSLLITTRFDYALIVIPIGLWVGLKAHRAGLRPMLVTTSVFATPIAVWLVVAFVYYGNVLPNTYYAKLNIDIPRGEILFAGIRYLAFSFETDPVIAMVICAAIVGAVITRSSLHRVAAASMVMYMAYVVSIGGDFMAGRFLTAPAFIALWIVATAPISMSMGQVAIGNVRVGLVTLLPVVVCFAGLQPMILDRPDFDSPPRWDFERYGGIADEANGYRYGGWSLMGMMLETRGMVEFSQEEDGYRLWQLRRLEQSWFSWSDPEKFSSRDIAWTCGGLGRLGMTVGPAVHVVDTCGLTDPFLSRLPYVARGLNWRIGHFERSIPPGYLDAVRFEDSRLVEDPVRRQQLEDIWTRVR